MRAEGHQPHCARLAALHRRETGPWPMKQKNETDNIGCFQASGWGEQGKEPSQRNNTPSPPGDNGGHAGHHIFLDHCTVRPCR